MSEPCAMEGCKIPAKYAVAYEGPLLVVCGRHLAAAAEAALGPVGDEAAETGDRPTIDRVARDGGAR